MIMPMYLNIICIMSATLMRHASFSRVYDGNGTELANINTVSPMTAGHTATILNEKEMESQMNFKAEVHSQSKVAFTSDSRQQNEQKELLNLIKRWQEFEKEPSPTNDTWYTSGNLHSVFEMDHSNVAAKKMAQLIMKHNPCIRASLNKTSLDKSYVEGCHVKRRKKSLSDVKSKFKKKMDKVHKLGSNFLKNHTTSNWRPFNEYPGHNETTRRFLHSKWKSYYDCLENKTEFWPKAHYAFPGGSIKLTCNLCLQPGRETLVQWTMANINTEHRPERLHTSGESTSFNQNSRIATANEGLMLEIYGIQGQDAGNYTCTVFGITVSVHLLQVAKDAENLTKVWPDTARGKAHASPSITLPKLGVTVLTNWRNWTSCSRCGWTGKRFRIGVCTVSSANPSISSKGPKILSIFKDGLPCKSKLLPASVYIHPNIAQRQSEIMESFCKVPCPPTGKYVVRNEMGDVIEEADNAAGVYSMLQKIPRLPPIVMRKLVFLQQWNTAYLQCPGSLHNDAPVRWYLRGLPILEEGDRIHVTPSHILVIQDLGQSDSALYSCWQRGRLVGTIRLQVSTPMRLTFSQQISALAMVLIVLTFVIILCRAFCNVLTNRWKPNKF